MRIRLLLLSTSASLVAAGFAIQACGGSSEDTPAVDGGSHEASTETGAKDASPDTADARPPCDPTNNPFKNIPDASIADGASTTGNCLSCAELFCSDEVKDCQQDCSRSTSDLGCQDIAGKALECYAKTQDIITCATPFLSVGQPTAGIGLALGQCVRTACQTACGVPDPDGGDGG